jgi:excinuclease ABC subunit B
MSAGLCAYQALRLRADKDEEVENLSPEDRQRFIAELEEKMREAARKFDFEKAAGLRDRVKALKAVAV